MAQTIYTFVTGLNGMAVDWEGDVFEFMLLTGTYVPDPPSQTFVADIVADEIVAAGYARQTATGKTRTIDTGPQTIAFDCDDPDFGTPSGGAVAKWMVCYQFVTGDADSPIVNAFAIDHTCDGSALVVTVYGSGLDVLSTSCG